MEPSTATSIEVTPAGNADDAHYRTYLRRVQECYEARAQDPIFETDAEGLWDAFLGAFPEHRRQYHTCNACRRFIERFGHLVTVTPDGNATPLFWDAEPSDEERASVNAVREKLARAKITGVFLSSDAEWGTPVTGQWVHLGVRSRRPHTDRVKTAFQAAAEKREDHGQVQRALSEFSAEHVETAITLLRTDSLYRSEKVLGQAEFLARLHAIRSGRKNERHRENLIWVEIARAPSGFCHPKASMIGSLLEDIAAGKAYEDVARAFASKMHPLQYQRPQAAPSAGAIAQAEKIFEQLGLASALRRRFCRPDEVDAIWRPQRKDAPEASGGIFSHLKPKGTEQAQPMAIPAQTMTWAKFERDVLPGAEHIELQAPARGNYTAFVTACEPDAPPILQWDREDRRNPVSWYMWVGGSMASQWGLSPGYVEVDAICASPAHWNGNKSPHHADRRVFILRGARETRRDTGLALFPETIRSELHGVRSVIEAHSKSGTLDGYGEPAAAGLTFPDGNVTLRATSSGRSFVYVLDRME